RRPEQRRSETVSLDTESLRVMAVAPDGLRKPDAATESLDRPGRVDPMDRRTWNAKGAILGRLGRRDEALAAYDQSLNLNPGDRVALAAKGRILFDLGRIPEALKAFEDGLILEANHLEFLTCKQV